MEACDTDVDTGGFVYVLPYPLYEACIHVDGRKQ